jgi:hypothetical protein
LAPALLLLLAGSACGTKAPEDSATAAPTATTLEPGLLQAALDRSLDSTAVIEVAVTSGSMNLSISGAIDVAGEKLQLSVTGPAPIEVVGLGGTLYVQSEGPNGEPWMQVELERLRPDSQLRGGLDIRRQVGIVGGIVSVEQVGAGTYQGVADLNQAAAAADESQRAALTAAAAMAENASSVPYEAMIDDQGRLTRLVYTLELASGSTETDFRLSGFGEPVRVEAPPADDVWPATDELYGVL